MKRMICVLAVLCLLLTQMPLSAWAETTPLAKKGGEGTISAQINPLYADVLDRQEVTQVLKSLTGDAEPQSQSYVSWEEAAVQIREHLKNRDTSFTVYVESTDPFLENKIIETVDAAFEHTGVPTEGDYLTWQYGAWGADYYYSYDRGTYYVEVPFVVIYYVDAAQEAELDRAVEALLAELDLDGKTDYEKVCGVYEYITENIAYDYEHLNTPDYWLMYTAYAALVNKTAVCQGYANLLYRLLLELGVDNRIVVGDAGVPHGWNIVELDEHYYYVDSTWDAIYVQAGQDYEYFLRGSDFFTEDHTPDAVDAAFIADYPISRTDYGAAEEPDQPTEPPEEIPTLPEADYLEYEWEVLKLTNRERYKEGRVPLTTNKTLFQATDIRALELSDYYSDTRPDGSSFDTVLYDLGREFQMAGENKDGGMENPEQVVGAWMAIPDSWTKILSPKYTHMGVGYKETDGTYGTYWDQLFYTGWYCHYNSFELNTDTLTVEQGTKLDDLQLWGTLDCGECGECYLPILEEYCTGYDPNTLGTQTVTVSGLDFSDTLEITVVEAVEPEFPLTECLESEWEVLRLTNLERWKEGLDPVTTQDVLLKAAGIRADEITELTDHVRPDGSNFSTVLFDVEYPWFMAGENIAAGQRTPAEVVNGWMNSPGHRGNILSEDFMHLGVGYAPFDDPNGHYWVQLFTQGWECRYTHLELNVNALEVEQGTELEDLQIWATAVCDYCGDCYLPILPEYCTGYDPETPGTQTVTVSCLGLTDTLQITVLEDSTDCGDANGDGRINALDAIVLRQYLAGWDVTIDLAGADANGDGKVNALDAIVLRQYLAGWDVTLGSRN